MHEVPQSYLRKKCFIKFLRPSSAGSGIGHKRTKTEPVEPPDASEREEGTENTFMMPESCSLDWNVRLLLVSHLQERAGLLLLLSAVCSA
jgi:hypothetical protein